MKAVLWIRIRMDPHHLDNLDPDPHPHHIKIRIRIRIKKNQVPDPHPNDKLDPETDPDPHQFADDKPNYMECEPI